MIGNYHNADLLPYVYWSLQFTDRTSKDLVSLPENFIVVEAETRTVTMNVERSFSISHGLTG